MMAQFHSIKVNKINHETTDCVSVSFEIPDHLKDEFVFIPGQYLTLKMLIDGEDCRRSYSICSSFSEDLTVAIKKVPNGKMSTYINNSLTVGDTIDLMPPQGSFLLDVTESKTRKFVAFAAGSGITPIMSMVKQLNITEPNSEFLLFYSNKDENNVIFKDKLEELSGNSIEIKLIYTQQAASSPLYEGRIDEGKAKELINSSISCINADAFYLCGPEEMIFSVKNALSSFGVVDDKIKFELFTTPVKMAPKQEAVIDEDFDGEAMVTVICDDEEVEFSLDKDGDTILDAAMDEDLDVPFSCKGAVCCTCKAKVVEGKVTMDANYALSEQEVADGFVLACQSHPASAKVTIDFD
jgi:ring-1,2-phenylacetyl-CoA epoxidase subunit PaaE